MEEEIWGEGMEKPVAATVVESFLGAETVVL